MNLIRNRATEPAARRWPAGGRGARRYGQPAQATPVLSSATITVCAQGNYTASAKIVATDGSVSMDLSKVAQGKCLTTVADFILNDPHATIDVFVFGLSERPSATRASTFAITVERPKVSMPIPAPHLTRPVPRRTRTWRATSRSWAPPPQLCIVLVWMIFWPAKRRGTPSWCGPRKRATPATSAYCSPGTGQACTGSRSALLGTARTPRTRCRRRILPRCSASTNAHQGTFDPRLRMVVRNASAPAAQDAGGSVGNWVPSRWTGRRGRPTRRRSSTGTRCGTGH